MEDRLESCSPSFLQVLFAGWAIPTLYSTFQAQPVANVKETLLRHAIFLTLVESF